MGLRSCAGWRRRDQPPEGPKIVFRSDDLRRRVREVPDSVVTVPAGAAHKFANAGDDSVVAGVEVRPALKLAELLETTVALAEAGRTTRKGMPRPTALALFTKQFRREVRAAFPPAWVQRATLAPLGWMARKPLPLPAAA